MPLCLISLVISFLFGFRFTFRTKLGDRSVARFVSFYDVL